MKRQKLGTTTAALVDSPSSDLLTCAEAAKFLRLRNPGTLAVWRTTRRYSLPYMKLGDGRVFYRLADLRAFIDSRLVGADTEDRQYAAAK